MIIEWEEKYSLKHKRIDAQHQELFRLANAVQNLKDQTTTKAELSTLFKEFFDYMARHFKEEEAYMQRIDYPLLSKHHLLHEGIIEGMTKILKEKKSLEQVQERMKFIVQKWLVEHILDHDLKIEKWRKSISVEDKDLQAILP